MSERGEVRVPASNRASPVREGALRPRKLAMLLASIRMAQVSSGSNVRRGVLALSALLALIGTYWIGRSFLIDGKLRFGNPVEGTSIAGAAALDHQPRQVRAEVTRVTGNAVVRAGDMCEFLVERRRRDSQSFECNAQVVCGGRLLFGGPDRGFFPCRLDHDGEHSHVIGQDASTRDGDPAFRINTYEGIMRIRDDDAGQFGAFELEAEVLSVH